MFDGLYEPHKPFLVNDILKFLNNNPDLYKINSTITRNEGYLKSLKEDKLKN